MGWDFHVCMIPRILGDGWRWWILVDGRKIGGPNIKNVVVVFGHWYPQTRFNIGAAGDIARIGAFCLGVSRGSISRSRIRYGAVRNDLSRNRRTP